MGWDSTLQTLSYINDFAQAGNTFANSKGTIGSRLQTAGLNLFGGAMATSSAADLRSATGSSLGYVGKFSAGNNQQKALENTANASFFVARSMMPPASMYWNMNSYGMGMMGSGMYGTGMMGGGMYGGMYSNMYGGWMM